MKKVVGFVLCGALVAGGCASGAQTRSDAAYVRVDQVGFLPSEAKLAYLMSARDRGSVEFRVVDGSGRTAFVGTAGGRTGAWNDEFRDVRVLDLSAVTQAGTYRIEVAGAAASAPFWVGSDIFAPLISANAGFFHMQRDTAHRNDRQATVYRPPVYGEAGIAGENLIADGGPVDVSGGWADAGDYLKFTHTAAYSVGAMLVAQRDSGVGVAAEAKWGMEWLERMWDDRSGTLYAQVGIGIGNESTVSDHDSWRLPEADEARGSDAALARRPVFRAADPGKPISPNLAGKVTAAFALAAQVDSGESARRKFDKAVVLYRQAERRPVGELVTAYPHAFYPEASWQDDMEFAAAELSLAARALGDSRAAEFARDAGEWAAAYLRSDARGTLGLGDVSALAHADLVRLIDAGMDSGGVSRAELVGDLARQLDDGVSRAAADPFGAGAEYTEFDSVPHTFGLAVTALLYRSVTGEGTYDAFATRQRNWVLGANAWGSSFVIGVGSVFPRCPEHQIANLSGQILTGAVVNGPNGADKLEELNRFPTMRSCATPGFESFDGQGARYVDDVGAWQTVEPADDFTAIALLYFALAK
ncbi:glycoside hydrolase family 9 protein [Nocardia sp. NPDC051030]|uniref:glycoside hydrolase family 9 protein n=1 Tax=Nocardia sp. NPDC051030 TaxID=3155162 RepID=UPI003442D5D8